MNTWHRWSVLVGFYSLIVVKMLSLTHWVCHIFGMPGTILIVRLTACGPVELLHLSCMHSPVYSAYVACPTVRSRLALCLGGWISTGGGTSSDTTQQQEKLFFAFVTSWPTVYSTGSSCETSCQHSLLTYTLCTTSHLRVLSFLILFSYELLRDDDLHWYDNMLIVVVVGSTH